MPWRGFLSFEPLGRPPFLPLAAEDAALRGEVRPLASLPRATAAGFFRLLISPLPESIPA